MCLLCAFMIRLDLLGAPGWLPFSIGSWGLLLLITSLIALLPFKFPNYFYADRQYAKRHGLLDDKGNIKLTFHDGPPFIPSDFVQAVRAVDLEAAQSVLNELVTCGPANSHCARDCSLGRWSVVMCVREEETRDGWKVRRYLECFVTEHMHALIHVPLNPNAPSLMQQEPTLDAPPRTAPWENLMELLAA